jgi:uncharacterized protein (DUF433 family)
MHGGNRMNTIQSINLIAINPNVRRGRAHIVGTSVTVADVAIAHVYHGQDADGIASWYALTLPQVYAALAYYYDNKATIDEQIRDLNRRGEEYESKQVGSKHPLLP